jgi:ferric-dicitrate binding protein FerR (iron transport regulator)
MPPEERLYYLFDRYIGDSASAEELDELKVFLSDHSYEETAKNYLLSLVKATEPMAAANEQRLQAILHRMHEEDLTLRKIPEPYTRRLPVIRRWWAVAALFFGFAATIWMVTRPKLVSPAVAVGPIKGHDRAPGKNVALLTLSDGSSITLDSAHNGVLARQGNASVTKSGDGALAYGQVQGGKAAVVYNTLTTPRGGQYRLVLPDGSQVWLNAASSILYPTAFTGSERSVTITGEAYFEIAPDAAMPFQVRVNAPQGQKDITVLGTHFNVKAYNDEKTITTTLLEGSVQLAGTVLKPGEQGQWRSDGTMSVDPHANIEEAVAWKNGLFHFEGADLAEVMRQISRWYDVEVVFRGKVPDAKFEGEITRNSNLTEVFKILQLSNVHFTVEDKKVIVEQ